MKIKITHDTFPSRDSAGSHLWVKGEVYEVGDATGRSFIHQKRAVLTNDLALPWSRLEIGAGQECLFAPFLGEFGHMIASHIRIVHFSKASWKVVCCRKGDESLYPDADEFDTDWKDPIPDNRKNGTMRGNPPPLWNELKKRHPNAVFVPSGYFHDFAQECVPIHPEVQLPLTGSELPSNLRQRGYIVAGTRYREIGTRRNWPMPCWQRVADAICRSGWPLVIVGKRPNAPDLIGCTLHSDGNTPLAITLMQNCRLFVGTDSGAAHLAAACRAPMLVWRDKENDGMLPLIQAHNPDGFRRLEPEAWDHPDRVIAGITARLKEFDDKA